MTRFEDSSKPARPGHAFEDSDDSLSEILGVVDQHSAEVILFEVLPQSLDVIQLLRGVSREPKDLNEAFHLVDLSPAESRRVSGTIVQDQNDSPAGAARPDLQPLKHPHKQGGVRIAGSIGEDEWTIRPPHRAADRHFLVFPGGRDQQGATALPIGVDGYRKKLEADSIGEPELELSTGLQSPFFSLWRALQAFSVFGRFCRLRIVRLVLLQTKPFLRSNSVIHAGVTFTPVRTMTYSARRGAVHLLKANPSWRGSFRTACRSTRTCAFDIRGGRPSRGASSSPKCRRLNHRRFQFSNVFREIPSDRRMSEIATPAATSRSPVARFQTRILEALRRCKRRDFLSDLENEMSITDGMDRLPSLLQRKGYHAS